MKNKTINCLVMMQIMLMISMSFSFSYILNEASKGYARNSADEGSLGIVNIYKKLINFIFNNKTFASALSVSDTTNGVSTCLMSKNGTACSEFPASECDSKCTGACIPSSASSVDQCRLGTCYNPVTGNCGLKSPKGLCEQGNGVWYDNAFGDIAQCRLGCCLLAGQSKLENEQQCSREAELLGIDKVFRTDVKDELSCVSISKSNVLGACVYGSDENGKNLCKFGTQTECASMHGSFRENVLCSNPALNTSCEKQKTTACVPDRDGVYWFDSCGNRENIYSASRVDSYNNGFVQTGNSACILGSGNNLLQNAETCGNCNYLLGSICGRAKTGEVSIGDFVCKDLSCIDENGQKRQNGESWCSYQGSVGLDGNRATDTAGSRHYRETCVRGEITTEPCADYRNEICVESKNQVSPGKTFSTAACMINRWQECYQYNTKDELKNLCTLNPSCFVKNVNVDKNFKFDLCVPRYPPGFVNTENGAGESAEALCNFASQKCTKVMVKGLGGWSCVSNCECDTDKFAEQMNDLCISLGDCGTKANYLGTITNNFEVKMSVKNQTITPSQFPKLGSAYLGAIARYANENEFLGKVAAPPTAEQLQTQLGIPGWLGFAADPTDPTAKTFSSLQLPIGAAGLVATLASTSSGISVIGTALHVVGLNGAGSGATATWSASLGPTIGALGGALAGAAAGFAVVSLLLSFTGVGRGLPPALTYALMGVGVVAGAIIGVSVMAPGSSLAATLAPLLAVAWIAIVVVIVIIIIFAILGIGSIKKIDIQSKCMPWQAVMGGSDCSRCGSDGKPCSSYACASLGQNCQLINEMTDNPQCVAIARDDVTPPKINSLYINGTDYEYVNVNDNGFKIQTIGGECLEPGRQLVFAINLSEPGRCVFDTKHTSKYEDMQGGYFGVSSLYRTSHVRMMTVPSLEDLGYSLYNNGDKAEYNMYIRCQDKNGNSNSLEYDINFCIQKNIDVTPPVIVDKFPFTDKVALAQQTQNVSIYTNEPADCKWDSFDKSYSEMSHDMTCLNEENDRKINGWECRSEFPTPIGNSTYYVKCKDQPWLAEKALNVWNMKEAINVNGVHSLTELKQNGVYVSADGMKLMFQEDVSQDYIHSLTNEYGNNILNTQVLNETFITDIIRNGENQIQTRNVMPNSYNFSLSKSYAPFKVDSITPVDGASLSFGTQPATVQMKVRVSGGYDGTGTCYYKFGNQYILFSSTLRIESTQDFRSIYSGTTSLTIKCEDVLGNVDERSVSFNVNIDAQSPRATRIYSKGSVLYLITDENARCVYGNQDCSYNFVNGTVISGNTKEHSFSIDAGKNYYIKCKDEFDNNPGSLCSAIVRRGN